MAQSVFETPPTLKVSECVPEQLRKGKNFTISDPVNNDGFWNIYSLHTEVGSLTVHGSFLLAERIQESHALAELKKTDEIVLFGQGAANSMVHIGKSLYTAASDPNGTAEGLWPGLKRLSDRAGSTVQKTVEGLNPSQGEQSGQKSAQSSLTAAETFLGMQAIERRWARKLGVDPYTTNADLRKELQRVAAFEAAGGAVTKAFAHVPLAVSVVVMLSDMVWEKSPDELAKINQQRLAEMGVSREVSRQFTHNAFFSLTRQTLIISSISGLGNVSSPEAWIGQAARADTEELAVFFTESAIMLQRFNDEQAKIKELLPDSLVTGAVVDGNRVAFLIPADYLVWTEELQAKVTSAEEKIHGLHPGASIELWMTGKASGRTKEGLASRGWKIYERVLNRLSPSV